MRRSLRKELYTLPKGGIRFPTKFGRSAQAPESVDLFRDYLYFLPQQSFGAFLELKSLMFKEKRKFPAKKNQTQGDFISNVEKKQQDRSY